MLPLPIERYRAMRYISSSIVFLSIIIGSFLFFVFNNKRTGRFAGLCVQFVCLSTVNI